MAKIARTGSLVPSNLRVSYANPFLQPKQQPAHADVFTGQQRYIEVAPIGVPWTQLEGAVDGDLESLMYRPGHLGDLGELLHAIDEK